MHRSSVALDPTLKYEIEVARPDRFTLSRDGQAIGVYPGEADLSFFLDKDLTIQIEQRRPDLFFVHAGVLEYDGRACVVVAPSGTGKSTLVWTLLGAGFRYLSDELAPIELEALRVQPYPRALCLKDALPDPYRLPPTTITMDDLLYVPVVEPQHWHGAGLPEVATVVFLRRQTTRRVPTFRRLRVAEAGAHLYANALNPLAHGDLGLEAAISIVTRVPCYEFELGSIERNVVAFKECMQRTFN